MSALILAAIDLQHPDHNVRILRRAQQIATLEGARLAVITVLPDFGMTYVAPWFKEGALESALEDAGAALHGAVRDALGEEADAKALHILRQGTIYQEILAASEKHAVSLIVMGAHRPELRDYLIGPNAARVVRHAACSVLVLRD